MPVASLYQFSEPSFRNSLDTLLSGSVSSTSIFIAFLAGPCAGELTTSSVSLSPLLESGAVQKLILTVAPSLLTCRHECKFAIH